MGLLSEGSVPVEEATPGMAKLRPFEDQSLLSRKDDTAFVPGRQEVWAVRKALAFSILFPPQWGEDPEPEP